MKNGITVIGSNPIQGWIHSMSNSAPDQTVVSEH